MRDKQREIKELCEKIGVKRISHRRPLSEDTILSDLRNLAASMRNPNTSTKKTK